MRRRTVLLLAGSSLAALSGCSGDNSESTPETTPTLASTPTPDTTPTPDATPTPTPTDTPTPEATPTPEETPSDERDSPESIVEAGERFIQDMQAGEFDRALEWFRSDAQRQVSAGQLEHIWLGYTAVGGQFQEISDTEEVVEAGFDGVDLSMAFERGTHVMRVLVDDQESFAVVGIYINDEYERPDYVDTDAFSAQSATVETENCLMDAEITVPTDAESVPGVILVHGSDPIGAANMNLGGAGSRPFQDLAEGLASQGVAVLRYDRRSHACPNSLSNEEWTLDAITVDDALVALDRLRQVPAVDTDRTVVAGLSLGAMATPRIAERDGTLAGGVMLAAPARNFYEIFIEQFEHLANLGEYEWEAMQTVYERWRDRIDRIRNGDYAESDIVLDYPGALWTSVDEYDQIGTAQRIDTPLFLLQGTRDYQVSPERDFGLWQDALADRPNTRFELYENLNHVFQYGEGPPTQTEYSLANPVDEAVVMDIASWVQSL
jgi:pimeloyl-ACP methyl ester carboxylesterase